MVISFLVLWPICLNSILVHVKNGPEYLTRGKAQVIFWGAKSARKNQFRLESTKLLINNKYQNNCHEFFKFKDPPQYFAWLKQETL